MTSATDNRTTELREKLTERGMKYKVSDGVDLITVWQNGNFSIEFIEHRFVNGANPPTGHCTLTLTKRDCTPEQAIAATLGANASSVDNALDLLDEMNEQGRIEYSDYSRLHDAIATLGGGELTAEQVRKLVQPIYLDGYSDGSKHRWHGIEEIDWQAITDELNATLGDDDYERRMDELLCRLTNGKWSKSRSYSVDFMVSCVDEAYEDAALGGGECELVYGENDYGDDGWWCKSCGEWFAASFRHTGRNNIIEPSYCQHCGKAVKR